MDDDKLMALEVHLANSGEVRANLNYSARVQGGQPYFCIAELYQLTYGRTPSHSREAIDKLDAQGIVRSADAAVAVTLHFHLVDTLLAS